MSAGRSGAIQSPCLLDCRVQRLDEFALGAQHAELVAFGIGQHDPSAAGAVDAPMIRDLGGAVLQQPRDLLVAASLAWSQVEVQPILGRFGFRYLDEEHPMPTVGILN